LAQVPGSAGLVLLDGVLHLDEEAAVFEAMLTGWTRQQRSRLLGDATIEARIALLRRFADFAESYPWTWGVGDVEDFTVSLMSGEHRLAPSTVRGYHLTLRMFCDYLIDTRYEWPRQCLDRFGHVPTQVCHEWNTVAHLNDYEGRPARRPLTYAELQTLFDFLDQRVDQIARSGRKGALAALRDAQMFKTAYAFGLRRNELCRLDVADLRPNPHVRDWGTYGSVHVRYGKAIKGGIPRRRTVLAVPEFDWAIAGMRQWVEQGRLIVDPGDHPALWITERLTRVTVKQLDKRFSALREQAGLGPELTLHCLRHSYVTHLIEFGYPERFVQEQVGHAYASTTAIYTSVSNDFKTKTLQAALRRVYHPTENAGHAQPRQDRTLSGKEEQ
jgi:integrase/recombinase XerC